MLYGHPGVHEAVSAGEEREFLRKESPRLVPEYLHKRLAQGRGELRRTFRGHGTRIGDLLAGYRHERAQVDPPCPAYILHESGRYRHGPAGHTVRLPERPPGTGRIRIPDILSIRMSAASCAAADKMYLGKQCPDCHAIPQSPHRSP